MAVEFLKYSAIESTEWDQMVYRVPGASYEYTSALIEYRYACSPWVKENLSFLYVVDGVPLSAAVVFLEAYDGNYTFTASKDYLVAPFVSEALPFRRQETVASEVLKQVDSLAAEHGVEKKAFRLDPLCNCRYQNPLLNFNYLMKYGYQNTSINTQIIDLSKEVSELWSDVRKGHKANIKSGKAAYDVRVISGSSVSEEDFRIYKEMHHRAAGRQTRPDETFWMMHNWVRIGNGVLGIAYKDGWPISTVVAYAYGGTAYYASAAEDPGSKLAVPVGHVMQWETMMALKNMGVRFYEIGWQKFGVQSYSRPTEKEIHIASYKRGFGGETRSLFQGVK